jgi:hypothetical protein
MSWMTSCRGQIINPESEAILLAEDEAILSTATTTNATSHTPFLHHTLQLMCS